MRVSFCKSKSSPSLLWLLPFQLMTSHTYAPTMSHDKYMRRWLTHLLPTLQIKLTSYCIVIEVSEIKKKKSGHSRWREAVGLQLPFITCEKIKLYNWLCKSVCSFIECQTHIYYSAQRLHTRKHESLSHMQTCLQAFIAVLFVSAFSWKVLSNKTEWTIDTHRSMNKPM